MTPRFKTATALPSFVLQRGAQKLRAFRRDESGVMAYPTIAFFLAMLAVGGIGVDLMRLERDRTVLQYTLDRAVLAAADLDQTQSPAVVVQDYLNKAGLGEYYSAPIVESGLGYKRVQATINATFDAHLIEFSGGTDMPIYATSKAEESIDELEISLVLDVSGSMSSNSRLSNLKVAARDFIDTMVANTTDGKMSISVVPYATQVSLPDELIGQYNTVGTNDYSNCINFESSQFSSANLSTTTTLDRTMHFTPWGSSSYDKRTYNPSRLVSSPVCDERSSREILPLQKDAETLKTFIQNLSAGGNTSIDIGMKWGTALLDPSARPAISAISTGTGAIVPGDFTARPAEYSDADTIKIIVLMTDGQNTSQYYVTDPHREGNSGVWYNSYYQSYSTYDSRYGGRYYFHYNNSWYDHPYGNGSGEAGTAVHLSYAELFARTSLKYLYKRVFDEWMNYYDARDEWYYDVWDSYGNSTKNARTRSVCEAAKDQGIVVYTIGFEAPSDGVAVLRDCASTDAHYFDVDGLEIKDAFASIATSIRQLRLTQ
ncbi:TadE/TadG family type IV pilus assembly protein [Pseudophaeobacter sp.]|uniref:TadE/TadG family type IV pilus assembly protein n=1 Tax=Pseudophaeobacter sp. TaxID=1971739 RepID=UPI0032968776